VWVDMGVLSVSSEWVRSPAGVDPLGGPMVFAGRVRSAWFPCGQVP
jgi:hypothetical protein